MKNIKKGLVKYKNEAIEAGAHKGLIFYVILITFCVLLYKTM